MQMPEVWERYGKNIMNIFFDTEFTGLHKGTTLISIGMVAENGLKFYAEFTDFDKSQCNEWIEENVLKNMFSFGNLELTKQIKENANIVGVLDDRQNITKVLREWLEQFEEIQLVSDVCHYDMVLFIDLFGNAFDLPRNVSAVCHDINQDIARYYGISEKEAFDKSREEIAKGLCKIEIKGEKHNSLYDAEVIKAIYDKVNGNGQIKRH